MAEISSVEIANIVSELPIPAKVKICMDVGGGKGALMTAILEQHPKLNGIVFDLPETIDKITQLSENCSKHGGSFFDKETIPKVDMIILKRVIHDWNNAHAKKILKNCSEKCDSLQIIEWLWKENDSFVASLDFFLMSIGGKIRSEQEFAMLLKSADLEQTAIVKIMEGVFAISAKPVPQQKQQQSQTQGYTVSVNALIDRATPKTMSTDNSSEQLSKTPATKSPT